MATKLLVLAVSVLGLSAFANGSSNSLRRQEIPDKIEIDPATAKSAGKVFQRALDEERAGLEEARRHDADDKQAEKQRLQDLQDEMTKAADTGDFIKAGRLQKQLKEMKEMQASVKPHMTHLSAADKELDAAVAAALPNDHVTEFERDVTELIIGLSKSGFGATPMGSSVQKIKDLLVKDMMPKVIAAHTKDQNMLYVLSNASAACVKSKDDAIKDAEKSQKIYKAKSPVHKTCRATEAGLYQDTMDAWSKMKAKKQTKDDKCQFYSKTSQRVGEQNTNKQIVSKGQHESVETYVKRISSTICGKTGGKGNGGYGETGFLDDFLDAKQACEKATKEYNIAYSHFTDMDKKWHAQRKTCDNLQDEMDNAACKYATGVKDACETYADCYADKKAAFDAYEKTARKEETDRKAEWRGLKRMSCLIDAFTDGKVEAAEIDKCKKTNHSTDHLNLTYPLIPVLAPCVVPDLYPYTAAYKKAEFTPLPAVAKGKMNANECHGVTAIGTACASGSPSTCKCQRVTLSGPYKGAMVKCENGLDTSRSTEKNSCPAGTKLFAPRSRLEWDTFLKSATPLRAPHWIIDITRPQNGCGGCTGNIMNSGVSAQSTWRTLDGSPWWLRSTRYNEPNGDYQANCYLDLWHNPANSDSVTYNDLNCKYHSKSYYCQTLKVSLTPATGSPAGCECKEVSIATGTYSPGTLLVCSKCLQVSKSTQKNSCPTGTKLFAPKSRADWKAFLASATPLRDPHWIIDITRPQNGCGGCTGNEMNSGNAAQSTWKTSDGAAWWLRSTRYNEPNGDYSGNCYLDLWHTPANEDSVTWNDGNCNYKSKSYYCQSLKGTGGNAYKSTAPPWTAPVMSTQPNTGSPSSCKCTVMNLKGTYSAGGLLKCENCLDVYKSTQKNSCPQGTKLFAPYSRDDWKTLVASGIKNLNAPHWIVDITRPQNGCGGCTGNAMNSGNAKQSTWKTSDSSPWWLRANTYSEPNGDYHANCYLHLKSGSSADNVKFNDGSCSYHAKSYYCQPSSR